MEHFFVMGAAVLLFLWFFAPVVAGGKVNIGNMTGFVGTGLLFVYGVFMRQINEAVTAAWGHIGGRIALTVLILAFCVLFLIVVIETVCMVKAARNRPKEPLPAVLLGCSVKGTRPCTILRERMDAAYQYLISNPDVICILSGGMGVGEEISEAECMYRYLTEKGIAPERLVKEEQSTNTRENLRLSCVLMEERGLERKAALVTSEFHACRGAMIAREMDLCSYSVAAKTFWLYFPAYYVRELYGILHHWMIFRGKRK